MLWDDISSLLEMVYFLRKALRQGTEGNNAYCFFHFISLLTHLGSSELTYELWPHAKKEYISKANK